MAAGGPSHPLYSVTNEQPFAGAEFQIITGVMQFCPDLNFCDKKKVDEAIKKQFRQLRSIRHQCECPGGRATSGFLLREGACHLGSSPNGEVDASQITAA